MKDGEVFLFRVYFHLLQERGVVTYSVKYFHSPQYHKAKETYLHACRKSPSSISWRGVGISCYKVCELKKYCSTALYTHTHTHTHHMHTHIIFLSSCSQVDQMKLKMHLGKLTSSTTQTLWCGLTWPQCASRQGPSPSKLIKYDEDGYLISTAFSRIKMDS